MGRTVTSHAKLRLVDDEGEPQGVTPAAGADAPFSVKISLAIWAVMAALAWGAVLLVLHLG